MAKSLQQYAIVALFGLALGVFAIENEGCATQRRGFDDNTGGGSGDDGQCIGGACTDGGSPTNGSPNCVGLECQVNTSCVNGGHTTISGKVYDPAGVDGILDYAVPGVPLYNVVVYIPSDPTGALPKIKPGTTATGCNTCDANIGHVVTSALTDATGSFQLVDVPTGTDIPLVMQIGKWRREIRVPATADCADTRPDPKELRLPRNQTEGDIPQMAILTGGCDPLGCLFPRIGLDRREITDPNGGGRMHVYAGNLGGGVDSNGLVPDCSGPNCPLWQSSASPGLGDYDIVILACECSPIDRGPAADLAMHDWLNAGGKLFATHYHYTWFTNSPDVAFQHVASWDPAEQYMVQVPFLIDDRFAKGKAFSTWLLDPSVAAIDGTTYGTSDSTVFPVIALNPADVREDLTTIGPEATRWVWEPPGPAGVLGSTQPETDKYVSFETPIDAGFSDQVAPDGAPEKAYCGKAVYSDIHVGGTEGLGPLPGACDNASLTPQERALEFIFFDLSSCVSNDREPPPPPPR